MSGSTTAAATWFTLRRRTTIYPPEPAGRPGVCAVCRGPAGPGYARCFQCAQHDLLGRGLLADTVVPVSYAVKGTPLAASLWRYKSWRSPDPAARACLLALLLAFLHDHGRCVWRHAGMPAPGRLAVVPTGCGRPGPHPLLALAPDTQESSRSSTLAPGPVRSAMNRFGLGSRPCSPGLMISPATGSRR